MNSLAVKLVLPERVRMLAPRAALIAFGIAIGAILAALPLTWAAIGLAVITLLIVTVIYPLIGLSAALIFATFKPLTDYFVPELPLDIGQLALIATLGTWLVKRAISRDIRIPASPMTLPLLAFIGIGALSLLGALSAGYGLKELIKWGQIVAVMWLVQLEAGEKRWPVILAVVLAAGVVQAAIGIWQFGLRGDGPEHFLILNDRFYRAYGTFEQPNPYGGFLGLLLPLGVGLTLSSLGEWVGLVRACSNGIIAALMRTVGLGAVTLMLAAGLVASWSRGAWLGAGAAMLVVLASLPRNRLAGFGTLLAVVAIVFAGAQFHLLPASVTARITDFTSDITTNFEARGVDITSENYAVIERLAHWQAAQAMARDHLLLGVGLGNYEPIYPVYELLNWPYPLGHAHNIYLNMLAEVGIIGLFAYLVLWGVVFAVTLRTSNSHNLWRRALAIGLLGVWTHLSVHQLVDNLYVANIHLHIGALLGVLTILYEWETHQAVERID